MIEKDVRIYVRERSFTQGGVSTEERMLQQRASGVTKMKSFFSCWGQSPLRKNNSLKPSFHIATEQGRSYGFNPGVTKCRS